MRCNISYCLNIYYYNQKEEVLYTYLGVSFLGRGASTFIFD